VAGDEAGEDRGGPPGPWAVHSVAFEELGAGVLLVAPGGRITGANAAVRALLRRPAGDLLGADVHELLHRRPDGSPLPRGGCELLAAITADRTGRGLGEHFLDGAGRLVGVDWTAVPLRASDREAGAAVLVQESAERVADEAGRAGHLAALEELTERLTLVAEITSVLSQTLEVEESLRRLGRLLVPRLADWAVVDLVDLAAGPGEVRRASIWPDPPTAPGGGTCRDTGGGSEGAGGDAEGGAGWTGPLPPLSESSRAPLPRVLRGGEAVLLDPEDLAGPPPGLPEPPGAHQDTRVARAPRADSALAEAHHDLLTALGATSAVVAPLRTGREVLGALTVARTDPGRRFDAAELALMADIGRRAGLALDNARLFEQQHDIAVTLQRHLLTPLPKVGRLRLAARYLPAPPGSQVGGDWYDALVLADGVVALVIGDVMGHNLEAAAGMAQLRSMLRSLAWDRQEPPSAVVDRFDQAMGHISDVPMATLVLARVEGPERGPWRLHWTSAGHLPPLLVTHDGRARYLEEAQGLLLGARIGRPAPRRNAVVPLPARGTLLFYTDGLVEVPGTDLDTGLASLRRHAAALAAHPLEEFCDGLLERRPPGGTDDTALLALRLPG
jgi:GAF domain-containing protein